MTNKEDKQKGFLAPDVIISMITKGDNKVLEILRQKQIQLVTSDFALSAYIMLISVLSVFAVISNPRRSSTVLIIELSFCSFIPDIKDCLFTSIAWILS